MSRDLYEHEPERDVASAAAAPAPPREAVVVKPLPTPEGPIRPTAELREQGSNREDGRTSDRLREPVERYRLSRNEAETLHEIGRFRTIAVADLARFHYQGDMRSMNHDLKSFARRGLVRFHAVLNRGKRFPVVVLTKKGQSALEWDSKADPKQAIYTGLVKEREAAHDTAIYRMYQTEAAEIRARGGTARRVVLDYELKRKVYAPLAKDRPRLKPEEYAKRQAEVAAENGLEVVNGKIPLPDLRIEYQTREGEMAKVDLELATEHYKASQVAEKASAGFVVYSEGGGSKPEDRDLTSEILSL